ELGLEASEVRRRNFIQPDEFPWDVGLTFQDGGPTRYDSGDYPAGLEMALERIGFGNFRARQRAARAEGRHLGLGGACYGERTGTAVATAAGKVRYKALRLAADLLEVAPHDLEVRDGAVSVKGVPDRRLALGALATVANPIRYAYGKEAAEAALRLVKPRQGA